MLNSHQPIAIYMQDNLDSDFGKMGFGVMRYAANPVCCVVDSSHAGKRVDQVCELPFAYPVVADVAAAAALGAEVMILGTAPSGGRLPAEWEAPLAECLRLGMSLVNGLHDPLRDRLRHLLQPGRWVWDVRQPPSVPPIAAARAATLRNKRVLLVGTDMAVGKMTAGLEIHRALRARGADAAFLATGQIGITITGAGIPLDAYRLDHAAGAVETLVLSAAAHAIVLVEGQGSLLHPASSATLSLLRGACPTHLIMCHRAGMTHLRGHPSVAIPPLAEVIRLNEQVARAGGALPAATTIGVALNTASLGETEARAAIAELADEVALPVADVMRFGAEEIAGLL